MTIGLALVGLPQYLVLRERFSNAAWWLAAMPLGLVAGAIALALTAAAVGEIAQGLDGLVFGVGYGAVTGGALFRMLRPRAS